MNNSHKNEPLLNNLIKTEQIAVQIKIPNKNCSHWEVTEQKFMNEYSFKFQHWTKSLTVNVYYF